MHPVLEVGTLHLTRRPVALPLVRRVLRAALLRAAVRAAALAAKLERVEVPARKCLGTPEPHARLWVLHVEAAVLLAVAAYYVVGLVAVLLG